MRGGFTLIELLVVIAIISLLVSILLPSLTQAKELAKRAVCMSNLHNIGLAIATYAEDFDEAVPLHMTNHSGGPSIPWRAYAAYWGGGWPVIGGKRAAFNLAMLEALDLVPSARMFYCPSMTDPRHTFETFQEDWALSHERRLAWAVSIRTGYLYHPHQGRPYNTLSDFPADKALALDILMVQDTTAHVDLPGWQLLYADAHAELKIDEDTFEYIGTDPNVMGHKWPVFNFARDQLEQR